MRRIDHVSFDLDGTLIDSFPVMKRAWDEATRALGVACGFEEYRKYVGLPFPRILAHLGLEHLQAELSDLYFARTRAAAGEIRAVDGAADLLASLREAGLGLSIVTSKPRRNAEDIVGRMGFAVDVLVCGDDLPRGKPDPMAARHVSDRCGVAADRMLYVGDMIYDLLFALNSGMRFVLFAHDGPHLPRNLRNPIASVTRLADIGEHLS